MAKPDSEREDRVEFVRRLVAEIDQAGAPDDALVTVSFGQLRALVAAEQEYREVAGIVCLDVDLMANIADPAQWPAEYMVAEKLRKHIVALKARKDEAIADPGLRLARYNSLNLLFSAAAAGLVRSGPVGTAEMPCTATTTDS